jgi:hypothetical protein
MVRDRVIDYVIEDDARNITTLGSPKITRYLKGFYFAGFRNKGKQIIGQNTDMAVLSRL